MQNFRITLQLVGSGQLPEGSEHCGYELEIPLNSEYKIDERHWRTHKADYRVTRLWVDEKDRHGQVVLKHYEAWYFQYDDASAGSEPVLQLGKEEFYEGQFVNIRDHGDEMHIFKVVEVSAIEKKATAETG